MKTLKDLKNSGDLFERCSYLIAAKFIKDENRLKYHVSNYENCADSSLVTSEGDLQYGPVFGEYLYIALDNICVQCVQASDLEFMFYTTEDAQQFIKASVHELMLVSSLYREEIEKMANHPSKEAKEIFERSAMITDGFINTEQDMFYSKLKSALNREDISNLVEAFMPESAFGDSMDSLEGSLSLHAANNIGSLTELYLNKVSKLSGISIKSLLEEKSDSRMFMVELRDSEEIRNVLYSPPAPSTLVKRSDGTAWLREGSPFSHYRFLSLYGIEVKKVILLPLIALKYLHLIEGDVTRTEVEVTGLPTVGVYLY